ncbi:MAG: CPBP family glutamic-type intramembrane protease [Firmicutes bacterium]|nr:CPBP family glutamic-type intramembrane protease [Bacillota bacterium]
MKNLKLVFILSFRIILFISVGLLLSLVSNRSLSNLNQWWSIIISIVNFFTLIMLYRLIKKENMSYRKMINWGKSNLKMSVIVFYIFLIILIGMIGMFLAGFLVYGDFPYLAIFMIKPIPFQLALINIFILPLTTTLAEDGLYLGYSVNRINNKWLAILLPAFFYALQHSFIPLLFDFSYMSYRFLSFLPLTIIFTFWYYKKRDPVPIMISHFIINIGTVIQIAIASAN